VRPTPLSLSPPPPPPPSPPSRSPPPPPPHPCPSPLFLVQDLLDALRVLGVDLTVDVPSSDTMATPLFSPTTSDGRVRPPPLPLPILLPLTSPLSPVV